MGDIQYRELKTIISRLDYNRTDDRIDGEAEIAELVERGWVIADVVSISRASLGTTQHVVVERFITLVR